MVADTTRNSTLHLFDLFSRRHCTFAVESETRSSPGILWVIRKKKDAFQDPIMWAGSSGLTSLRSFPSHIRNSRSLRAGGQDGNIRDDRPIERNLHHRPENEFQVLYKYTSFFGSGLED